MFFLTCLFLLAGNVTFSQTVTQLQKKADELFKKEDYAASLVDFRQLLAQNPTSVDFNFKYGVCLFHSDNRKGAKRYFEFVLRQINFPTDAFYYLAKIVHAEYKFSLAIDLYQKYRDNTPLKLRKWSVDEDIEQCKNGKTLLQKPMALRLINSNRVSLDKFYLNYELVSRTGGFFTDVALQSKNDKKVGFLPMYYFTRGDSLKFFASYGANTQKDIYFSRKLSATEWSPAIKVLGDINTPFDEDYPFFDEGNGVLYFSSTGHNSIGGYDVFKVNFNPASNFTQNTSNLDFPYSSANDDYLFVPEKDNKTAFFASNRLSQRNKIDVFEVETSTKKSTLQLIRGDFSDLVDEKNTIAQIKVLDVSTGVEFGPFTTDESGKYAIVLPGGGTYTFSVTVEGSRQLFQNTAVVPAVKENNKISQSLKYVVKDASEVMEFFNYFDGQDASEDDKLLVLSAIASLTMNPTLVQTKVKEPINTTDVKSLLVELGYNEANQTAALSKLNDDLIAIELVEENLSEDLKKAILFQQKNSNDLNSLNKAIQAKNDELNTLDENATKKIQSLKELQLLQQEKLLLQQQMIALDQLIAKTETNLLESQKLDLTKSSANLNEKLVELILIEVADSLAIFLSNNRELIQNLVVNAQGLSIVEVDKNAVNLALVANQRSLVTQLSSFKSSSDSLTDLIRILNDKEQLASKKDREEIAKQISREKEKLALIALSNSISLDKLAEEEQKLRIEFAKIAVTEKLEGSNLESLIDGSEQTDSKPLRVTIEDLTLLSEEKVATENLIVKMTSSPDERSVLNEKIELLSQQEKTKDKLEELLALLAKKESVLDVAIKSATERDDFLTINSLQEEQQNLKNDIENFNGQLNDLKTNEKLALQNAEELRIAEEAKKATEALVQSEKVKVEKEELAKEEKAKEEIATQANEQLAKEEKAKEEKAKEEIATQEIEQRAKQEKAKEEKAIADKSAAEKLALQNAEELRIAEDAKKATEALVQSEKVKVEKEQLAKEEKAKVEIATQAKEQLAKEEKAKEEKAKEEIATEEKVTADRSAAEKLALQNTEELRIAEDAKKASEALVQSEIEQRAKEEKANEEKAKVEIATQVKEQLAKEEKAKVEIATQAKEQLAKEEKAKEEIATQEKVFADRSAAEKVALQNAEELRIAEDAKQTRSEVSENKVKVAELKQNSLIQLNSPVSNELVSVIDKTSALKQSILSDNLPSREQELELVKAMQVTNELLENHLLLADKLANLELKFPTVNGITRVSLEEAKNTLVIQAALLKTQQKSTQGPALGLLNQQIEIVDNEIARVENSVRESSIDNLQLSVPPNFSRQINPSDREINAVKQDAAYSDYLQKRIVYNNAKRTLDSLTLRNSLEKQKLANSLAQFNGNEENINAESELAKSISENNLRMDDLVRNLLADALVLQALPNQQLMEAMLVNKIEPISPITEVRPMDLSFNLGQRAPSTSAGNLPVLTASPSGLIYRVQVGAFRKPVALDKFREFTPVSGEVLKNGLTCYLAGFFNNTEKAVNARKAIRDLGYADAFIVAYCDGVRISIAEAKELERSGKCIPKTDNEIAIEVAALYKQQGIDNLVDNSLKKEEVFLTVQVAVYNKPITGPQLAGIEELAFDRSPKGQYFYTSGKFASFELANNRKNTIIQQGITDAYLVAFRNGQRIPLDLAKQILLQQEQVANMGAKDPQQLIKIDFNKLEEPKQAAVEYVQFIKSADTLPTVQLLGALNRGGTFVFDVNQQALVSGFLALSSISAFERIYYADLSIIEKQKESAVFLVSTGEKINAACHDWLIHCTIPYSILPKNNTFELQFVISSEVQIPYLKEMADKFNYSYKLSQL